MCESTVVEEENSDDLIFIKKFNSLTHKAYQKKSSLSKLSTS